MKKEKENKNQPDKVYRDRELSLARWPNKTKATDDKPAKVFYSYTLERTYKKEEQHCGTAALNHQHLLRAANLYTEAYNDTRLEKSEEKNDSEEEIDPETEPEDLN